MRKVILLLITSLSIISCGGKKAPVTPTPAPSPTAATLSSPTNNEACISGNTVSSTESRINFNWSAAANADSYVLTVTNLITKVQQTQTTSANNLSLVLQVNTPYSWFVTSKSGQSTVMTNSSTWKFYNAGAGVSSYPPYPAEIISPTTGQLVTPNSGKITLQWKGSDADNDIVNYDVYLGTTATPSILQAQSTASSLANVSVNSNTTYYWKVITRDAKGNTSDSGLYEFKTN